MYRFVVLNLLLVAVVESLTVSAIQEAVIDASGSIETERLIRVEQRRDTGPSAEKGKLDPGPAGHNPFSGGGRPGGTLPISGHVPLPTATGAGPLSHPGPNSGHPHPVPHPVQPEPKVPEPKSGKTDKKPAEKAPKDRKKTSDQSGKKSDAQASKDKKKTDAASDKKSDAKAPEDDKKKDGKADKAHKIEDEGAKKADKNKDGKKKSGKKPDKGSTKTGGKPVPGTGPKPPFSDPLTISPLNGIPIPPIGTKATSPKGVPLHPPLGSRPSAGTKPKTVPAPPKGTDKKPVTTPHTDKKPKATPQTDKKPEPTPQTKKKPDATPQADKKPDAAAQGQKKPSNEDANSKLDLIEKEIGILKEEMATKKQFQDLQDRVTALEKNGKKSTDNAAPKEVKKPTPVSASGDKEVSRLRNHK